MKKPKKAQLNKYIDDLLELIDVQTEHILDLEAKLNNNRYHTHGACNHTFVRQIIHFNHTAQC